MFIQLPLRPGWALRRLKRIGLLTSPLLMALLALAYLISPAAAQTPTPSFQGLGQLPGTMSGGGPWGSGVGLDNTIWLTQFDGNKVLRIRVVA